VIPVGRRPGGAFGLNVLDGEKGIPTEAKFSSEYFLFLMMLKNYHTVFLTGGMK